MKEGLCSTVLGNRNIKSAFRLMKLPTSEHSKMYFKPNTYASCTRDIE